MGAITLAALLIAAAGPARFDFRSGVEAHARQDYATARTIFLDLAELGDGPSLFNLGAMELRGEGAARDAGAGAGYLTAAAEAGYEAAEPLLAKVLPGLSASERVAADAVLRRFGRDALAASVLPPPEASQAPVEPPRILHRGPVTYPASALDAGRHGLVVVSGTIGADGVPRDARVALVLPSVGKGGKPFAAEALRAFASSRFAPARRGGQPIPVRYQMQVTFRVAGEKGPLRTDLVAEALAQARAGEPEAQLAVALLAGPVPRPQGIDPAEADRLLLMAAQSGLPEAQYELGQRLLEVGQAARAQPWLARAARAGHPDASLALGLGALAGPTPDPVVAAAHLARGARGEDPALLRRAALELACSPHPALRLPEVAATIAAGQRLAGTTDSLTCELAAVARAAAGDLKGAVLAERLAIAAVRKAGADPDPLGERLAAYAAGRVPCESLRAAWGSPALAAAPSP